MSKSIYIEVTEDVSFLRIPIVIDPDEYFSRKSFEHGVLDKCKCILKISCPATDKDQAGISFPLELTRTALKEALKPIRWRIFFPEINGMHVEPSEEKQDRLDFRWFGKTCPNTLYNNDKANNDDSIEEQEQRQLVWKEIPKKIPQEEFGFKTFLTKTWYKEDAFNISADDQKEIAILYQDKTVEELVFRGFNEKNASLETIAEYLLDSCITTIKTQTKKRNDENLNEALRKDSVTFSLELCEVEQGFSVGACETIDPFLPPEEDKKDSEPSPR